jgi:hypothetical protein
MGVVVSSLFGLTFSTISICIPVLRKCFGSG